MSQENTPRHEDDPKVTYRTVKRNEEFSLDKAVASLDAKRSENGGRRLDDFLHLAGQVDTMVEARRMRDRVIAVLSSRDLSREEWAQQVIAVLNDKIDQFTNRDQVSRKPAARKSQPKLRILKQAPAIQGEPVELRVGRVTIQAVISTAKVKSGEEVGKNMLHIVGIAGGSIQGVSQGAAYNMSTLPKALKGVDLRPVNSENSEEQAA